MKEPKIEITLTLSECVVHEDAHTVEYDYVLDDDSIVIDHPEVHACNILTRAIAGALSGLTVSPRTRYKPTPLPTPR